MTYVIKRINEKDWLMWKDIRLEALQRHPESFGGSYEDESKDTKEDLKKILKNDVIFGAYKDDDLIGIAAFSALPSSKALHKGNMYSVYVKDEHRGTSVSKMLISSVVEYAKTVVEQLHCNVMTGNSEAINLYTQHGFEIYGTEPRAIKIDNHYYDYHHMVTLFNNAKV